MTQSGGSNIVQLFLSAGPTAKAVLIILGLFSLASWTIIVGKIWSFSRAGSASRAFLSHFRKSRKFADVLGVTDRCAASPLVGIFKAGYAELDQQVKAGREGAPAATGRLFVKSLAGIERALERAAGVETTRLTKRLPFLATTAAATPFIGLFGTVWGIMSAFEQIGITGSTSIVAVAPRISEALVNNTAGRPGAGPRPISLHKIHPPHRGIRSPDTARDPQLN